MPEPCKYAAPIDKNGRPMEPEQTDILCPDPPVGDGRPMIKRTGRFGPFLAAASYPDVQYIVKLNAKTGAVELPKPPPMECDIVCEKCGEETGSDVLRPRLEARAVAELFTLPQVPGPGDLQ